MLLQLIPHPALFKQNQNHIRVYKNGYLMFKFSKVARNMETKQLNLDQENESVFVVGAQEAHQLLELNP